MKGIKCSIWAKCGAALIFCLAVTAAVGCALGVCVKYSEGWHKDEFHFESSGSAAEFASKQSEVLWRFLRDDDLSSFEGDPSYAYSIKDADGKLLASSTDMSSALIGSWHYSDGGEKEYIIESYVNLPPDESSECYDSYLAVEWLYSISDVFLPLGAAAALVALVMFIFLMTASGCVAGEERVKLRGPNRIPFDLLTAALAMASIFCLFFNIDVVGGEFNVEYAEPFLLLGGLCIAVAALCLLLFCMSAAARFRAGGWWRNTIIYIMLRCIGRGIKSLFAALPIAWRGVVAYVAFMLLNLILVLSAENGRGGALLLAVVIDLAALVALMLIFRQLNALRKAGAALAAGDLTHTVDTSKMWLDIKAHGDDLNSISLGMSKAVEERMRSERLKTELITNVSHDLKTPLTSIVSYVDLLKNEDVQNDAAREYIEVLDRQSAKLKKLTEDLVEASKASSGAVNVSLEKLDVSELLNQCAGEYVEKLRAAGMELVATEPEEAVIAVADGRLLWRVLENIMQNALKYSMPGTRVYLSVAKVGHQSVISVKNISREPLNIPASELMERFVRGDSSRSTEGSGLGLSIAKSLTELMGGKLELALDGDLFRVDVRLGE